MKNRICKPFLLPVGVALLLGACGQDDPPTGVGSDVVGPDASGAEPWVYSAPATVQPLAVGGGATPLSFGQITAARNGWGPIEKNRSNGEQGAGDGQALTLNGQVHAVGWGVHAGSEISFQAAQPLPACARLSAEVGVDDEVGRRGSVVFQVFADGVRLFDSGVMTGDSPARRLDLNLGGRKALRLVVTDAGDGRSFDHADWASPTLSCPANAAPTLTLDQGTLSVFHKHSATLRATFGNLRGPVDLRLEVDPAKATGLTLQTTRVELPASGGAASRDLVIRADGLPPQMVPDPDPLTAPYRLVASQGGRDVASVPVTITQRLLTVSSTTLPGAVRGRAGETRRVTVALTVSPPLERPEAFDLLSVVGATEDHYTLVPVGPVSGDGGTMRRTYDLTLNADYPGTEAPLAEYYVQAGDFAGYRLPWYWNEQVSLAWSLVR